MTVPPLDGLRPSATILATDAAVRPSGADPDAGFGSAPASWMAEGGAGGAGSSPPATGQRTAFDPMEIEPLNLARRPFVNTRPVVRVALILVLMGLALLLLNLSLFMGYLSSSRATRSQLAKLTTDTEKEKANVAALSSRIDTLRLDQENREVVFLNRKIDERTFSWSLLFDRLSSVLPDQVRLLELRPSNLVQKESALPRSSAVRATKLQPVMLAMHCETKDDEAMLRFVDNLFAHEAFSEPNLVQEERGDDGLVKFEINVQYQPGETTNARRGTAVAGRGAGAASSGRGAGAAKALAEGDTSTTSREMAPPATAADASGASLGAAGSPASADAVALAPPRPSLAAGAGLVRVTPPGSRSAGSDGFAPPGAAPAGPPQRLVPRHRGTGTAPIGAGSAPNNGVSEQ